MSQSKFRMPRFLLAALMAVGFGLAPAIATASSPPPPAQQNEDAVGMGEGCGFKMRPAVSS